MTMDCKMFIQVVGGENTGWFPIPGNTHFCEGDNHGHIERIMVRRDQQTGEIHPGLFPVKSYRPAYDDPKLWLQQNSEHFPVQHVTQNVKDAIEAAKQECPACDEKSIREWNENRLKESKNIFSMSDIKEFTYY